MKSFSTETEINAPPDVVWSVLTDGSKYTEWDPGMISLDGTIAHSEPLTIYAKISPDRAFKVKVSTFEPNRKMVWSSGMPLGLFKGERTFTLKPNGSGGTHFSMTEAFSGPMLVLIGGTIPDLKPTFDDFAAALKQRAEAAVTA